MKSRIENFIGEFDDAFSKEYCDAAIKYFEDMDTAGLTLTRQQQTAGTAKINIDDKQLHASNEVCITHSAPLVQGFNNVFWGGAYPQYVDTFGILKTASPHTNYAFKIQKTNIGQGYHVWHCENSDRANANRLLVWSLYLNDVEEGGETEFLYYPKRIKPKAGTLLIWPAGFQHAHRGNPPISNTKYIITGWVEL
jgi:hypothetical protein